MYAPTKGVWWQEKERKRQERKAVQNEKDTIEFYRAAHAERERELEKKIRKIVREELKRHAKR